MKYVPRIGLETFFLELTFNKFPKKRILAD